MKIYTSYFGNISRVKNTVAICAKSPDWYAGKEYKILAPKYSFFSDYKKGLITSEDYTRLYNEQILNKLNFERVYAELTNLHKSVDEITLLCYEKPNDFCHRHLVACWFKQNGIEVIEK